MREGHRARKVECCRGVALLTRALADERAFRLMFFYAKNKVY